MFQWFNRNRDIGLLVLRIFTGVRLIYGVQDNILNWERMREFEAFLQQNHFPFPMVCAIVSVYAQAIAGVCLLLGWMTRTAAIVMAINFIVALVMVHRGESFEQITAPLFMLVVPVTLLFTGAGRYSVDKV